MTSAAASAGQHKRARSDAWHLFAVAVVAFIVLVARRPEAIFRSEFSFEGGSVFYIGTYFGSALESLFRPYAGYQHLLPRIISFGERAVSVELAPLVSHLISLALLAGLAAFVASDRLRTVVPSRLGRIGLAALVVVLPNTQESLGVVGDIQRYIPIYLLALAFAAKPRRGWVQALELTFLAVISISGLFAALMQPLFWWRAWRERDRYSLAIVAIFAAGALVQLASIAVDGRNAANLADPSNLARIWIFRTITEGFIGQRLTFHLSNAGIPILLGAAITAVLTIVLVVLWWKALEPPIRMAVAYVWLLFAITPVFAQTEGVAWLSGVGAANRYFLVPSAMACVVVFAAFARLRRPPYRYLAAAGAVVLAIGIGGDLRLAALPEQGWAHNSACIGGPRPCVVPVYEPGDWSIVWPGSHGTWVQPRPGG
jgi:hypothetical protein